MNISNKETILIKNIEQLKQTIKDRSYNNYELMVVDNKIMIKGVKCSKPEPKAPEWFTSWVKNQYEKDIKHINNRIDNVDTRLDNVDKRLDNVVKLNKLKE